MFFRGLVLWNEVTNYRESRPDDVVQLALVAALRTPSPAPTRTRSIGPALYLLGRMLPSLSSKATCLITEVGAVGEFAHPES